jgi:hypothetical protein
LCCDEQLRASLSFQIVVAENITYCSANSVFLSLMSSTGVATTVTSAVVMRKEQLIKSGKLPGFPSKVDRKKPESTPSQIITKLAGVEVKKLISKDSSLDLSSHQYQLSDDTFLKDCPPALKE